MVAVTVGGWVPAAAIESATPDDRAASVTCLAQAIVFEAGNEPRAGQQAVAEVVLNRLRHPAFPKTVCGVVYQGSTRRTGCQFTFTCDGSLRRIPSPRAWAAAVKVAADALDGILPETPGSRATHYHADYVAPRWAAAMVRLGSIGAHIFYRFPVTDDPRGSIRAEATTRTNPLPVFRIWGLSVPSSPASSVSIAQ